ncbi:hypothetical protein PENARI_c043G02462 [Penicillium arizonense]|uniref:Uncharacterized protein n=1 Tax=Penicillium arizonense TaxID=1835702 RepID=A0A1F5L2K9_PENAI|nr:hypothetical protein PENARI_c043G02462 [Penicillium arizonense]OGE47478.1 hypothetical protein PENARI_c043G02462 [Penicillium arizonense]
MAGESSTKAELVWRPIQGVSKMKLINISEKGLSISRHAHISTRLLGQTADGRFPFQYEQPTAEARFNLRTFLALKHEPDRLGPVSQPRKPSSFTSPGKDANSSRSSGYERETSRTVAHGQAARRGLRLGASLERTQRPASDQTRNQAQQRFGRAAASTSRTDVTGLPSLCHAGRGLRVDGLTLEVEAHVLPTHLRLRHRAQNTIAGIHTLPRDHPIWGALLRAQKRRNNIGSYARFPLAEALKTMNLGRLDELETIDPRPLPPRRAEPFTKIETASDRGTARERAETIQSTSAIVVYSDASGRECHLGAAVVALDDNLEYSVQDQPPAAKNEQ